MAQDMTEYLIKYTTKLDELNKAKSATDELTKKIRETDVDYSKLDKNQRKVYDKIVRNSNSATTATQKFKGAVSSAIGGYLSFMALKQAVTIFANYDDALKRTQALTGASADETERLAKQSRLLGRTTAFTASQVATAQGNMAQTGLKVNQILDATPAILSLASASQMELVQATDIVTSSLNIFGLEADKASNVSDIFATAQAKSAGTAQWFSMAIQNSGANARSLGYSLEDTTAILATLAPAFKEGGSAGTALNAILRDLSSEIDKQGNITLNNQKIEVARNGTMLDMATIISNVSKATNSLTDVQKKQALATIFGDEAIRGFNGLLLAGSDQLKHFDNIMGTSTGTATAMANKMESGLGGSIRQFTSAVQELAIGLNNGLEPILKGVIDTSTGLIMVVGQIINLYEEFPLVMWGATTAVGAYIAYQKRVVIMNTLMNASNPFGWMKIGITGALIALGFLEKKFAIVSKAFEKVKSFFGVGSEEDKEKATTQAIQQTQNSTIPAYAKGTKSAIGGLSLVGEEGPELVNLKKGSSVTTAKETSNILGKGKTITIGGDSINITINSSSSEDVIEEIKTYLDRRERRKNSQILQMLGGA